MSEIKELVGIAESKDPTDRDRFHLKTLVRKLKQRNETLSDENRQMGGVIDAFKSGRYNESETAKMMVSEQQMQMKEEMTILQSELEYMRRENATLKVTASKGVDLQSAMQSNNAAINEKIESSNKLVKEKEVELTQTKNRVGQLEMESAQLREEISIYKGRCTNLARDVEMHYNEMHKLNNN